MVEDDQVLTSVLKDYLESIPYEVVIAENGVEAVRAILNQDFDAIVCDLMMPKLSGDMFYIAIERTKPHLCKRFVFITGAQKHPEVDLFVRHVGGTILSKPFHMEMLRESIELVIPR